MSELLLTRNVPEAYSGITGIWGVLTGKGLRQLFTLERPWAGNAKNLSCIPTGRYELKRRTFGGYCERYKKRFDHEFSIEVADVPGRSAILIHTGNVLRHTRGCILVGNDVSPPDNQNPQWKIKGGTSILGYKRLYDWMKQNKFASLRIVDAPIRESEDSEAEADIDRDGEL